MKIVQMDGQSQISLIDVEPPVAKPDEVVIQRVFSALCGSELGNYRGDGKRNGNNGHEAAGIVHTVGSEVKDLEPGQRVGVSAVVGCGHCDACHARRYTWCREFSVYTNMHAEYFVIPARACHVLPDDLPWEEAVLLSGDGLGVPYHTSRKLQDAAINTIAVFGLGPIGLGHVLLQAHLGRRVIGIDIADYRLEMAERLGAATVLKSDETITDRILDLTQGNGVDATIEAAGRPETVRNCFAVVKHGGTVIFNGELDQDVLSPGRDFIRRDIQAIGAWFYHFSEFGAMLKLYHDGLRVRDLITHQYPMQDAAEAFENFASGSTGKVLLRA